MKKLLLSFFALVLTISLATGQIIYENTFLGDNSAGESTLADAIASGLTTSGTDITQNNNSSGTNGYLRIGAGSCLISAAIDFSAYTEITISYAIATFGGNGSTVNIGVIDDNGTSVVQMVTPTSSSYTSQTITIDPSTYVNGGSISICQSGTNRLRLRNLVIQGVVPTPVELISFEGSAKNKNVDLSWSTASEENNSHFEIEYSTNGRDFTYIDKVVGVGTTAEIQNYQFTHTDVAAGKNYYRLRQVDFDGAFEYSSVAVVTMRTDAVIEVYPTMVASSVQVVLEKSLTTDVTLQVVDITGRQIQTGTIAKGTEQFELNVNDLDKGAYFIQFNVAGEVITRRFVKM